MQLFREKMQNCDVQWSNIGAMVPIENIKRGDCVLLADSRNFKRLCRVNVVTTIPMFNGRCARHRRGRVSLQTVCVVKGIRIVSKVFLGETIRRVKCTSLIYELLDLVLSLDSGKCDILVRNNRFDDRSDPNSRFYEPQDDGKAAVPITLALAPLAGNSIILEPWLKEQEEIANHNRILHCVDEACILPTVLTRIIFSYLDSPRNKYYVSLTRVPFQTSPDSLDWVTILEDIEYNSFDSLS